MLDDQGRIRALPEALGDLAGDRLTPQGLAEIAALDPETLPMVEGNPRLGSCVARPGKFVCIGLNYRAHAAESNLPIPAEPVVFGKWSSAVVGPNDDVEIPRGSEKTDWEVELGVVIGTRGRYLTEAEALSHVAGYCVVHDVSERAFQLSAAAPGTRARGATLSARPARGWSRRTRWATRRRFACGWRSTASAIRTAAPPT